MKKINYAGPDITEDDADFVRDAVLNGFLRELQKTFNPARRGSS